MYYSCMCTFASETDEPTVITTCILSYTAAIEAVAAAAVYYVCIIVLTHFQGGDKT